MQSVSFYQNHLDRVSRSFAFGIACLEGPLRTWVSLAYLLCRILDTVEDAPWWSGHRQRVAYQRFRELLEQMDSVKLQEFIAEFPQEIPEGERLLLADSALVFADFHALPVAVRGPLREAILSMSRGMEFFQGRRLRTLSEVNQYCFFVAGLVGDILQHLVAEAIPQARASTQAVLRAHHFGLFLQKINLLKDQKRDEAEGRFLVPSRAELLRSLRENAEQAFAYLRDLPKEARGYRMFCATALFLGLESLPWLNRGWLKGVVGKLPRAFSQQLLAQLQSVLENDEALARLFAAKVAALPDLRSADGAGEIPAWFPALYSVARLDARHLQSLGMAS